MIESEVVSANLAALRARIESCGRDPDEVTILAVTKGFGPDAVAAANAAGLWDLGENYAQELIAKHRTAPDVRWHFIGRLQSNKIAPLADKIYEWQSLDRVKLISRVAEHAPRARVRVQVNISGEQNKGGCDPGRTADLVSMARDLDLDVVGLMGVASESGDVARQFRQLRSLAEACQLADCSMGMSGDLELALAEGSTMIRVGTGLFGPRPMRERGA